MAGAEHVGGWEPSEIWLKYYFPGDFGGGGAGPAGSCVEVGPAHEGKISASRQECWAWVGRVGLPRGQRKRGIHYPSCGGANR